MSVHRWFRFLPLIATMVAASSPSAAQCQGWSQEFGFPGVYGHVISLASFDDGTGPALYAGGFFTSAGVQNPMYIAKRDDNTWSMLGSGMNHAVYAMAVFDDGTGPALFAGGEFTTAGGLSASRIAKWDGTSWSALGSGVNDEVRALVVFDDGSGPRLFAGGDFTSAGGVSANGIAKWDGTSWSAVGNLMDSEVRALAIYDDGTGPALFAGGHLTIGISSSALVKWDGTSWSDLGSGIDDKVRALAVFDDGTGPALFVGGEFTVAGGVIGTRRIAKWDGTSWSALGSGMSRGLVHALTVFDDGTGAALYAGGGFRKAGGVSAQRIAKWDGTSWSGLGSGILWPVTALAVFEDSSGPALFAGGNFFIAGGVIASRIAKWDGASWSSLSSGLLIPVHDLEVFDDGTGPTLFATAGRNAAKWNGRSWSLLGPGMSGTWAYTLEVFDDGMGPALFVGGHISTWPTITKGIVKWNGTGWSDVGGGVDGTYWEVHAMEVFDDGSGPALFVGGRFARAGSVFALNIAKWDGTSWSPLGSGVTDLVHALAVFDDGTGPALHAGGRFTFAGGANANLIAKWDGTSWSALGNGMDGPVRTLAVFDDGTGPALFAGGDFAHAGGISAHHIAKWDGTSWSAIGIGVIGEVNVLEVLDDGTGPALFAGGSFTAAGGASANRIAKWNGTGWSRLGSGMNDAVLAIGAFDSGADGIPELYVAGNFTTAGGYPSAYVAQWRADTVDTDLDGIFDCYDNCPFDSNPGQDDCNGDGLGDTCAIAGGLSMDANFNGIPDECEGGGSPYCTGKTNSLGCVPFVSSVGFASLTSTNPFQVIASDCLPNQVGLLHYGYTKSNLSFHGGTLCLKAPIIQLPGKLASATGLPPCTGVLKSNMNKRIQSGVDPMLTAGAQVYAQWRQRDPNDPAGFGDSLTNGLTFMVQP